MANTVESEIYVDGSRNTVLKIHLESDGVEGELSGVVVVDASALTPATTDMKLMKIESQLSGFTAELLWDATTPIHLMEIPDYDMESDFSAFGGIINKAGAGKTGDIKITTLGFTAAGDNGHIILYLKKKNNA